MVKLWRGVWHLSRRVAGCRSGELQGWAYVARSLRRDTGTQPGIWCGSPRNLAPRCTSVQIGLYKAGDVLTCLCCGWEWDQTSQYYSWFAHRHQHFCSIYVLALFNSIHQHPSTSCRFYAKKQGRPYQCVASGEATHSTLHSCRLSHNLKNRIQARNIREGFYP
jgi:hypothetical protein